LNHFFLIIWTVLIFVSIAWYGFLIFYIGFKGGREIKAMTRTFSQKDKEKDA
jgi:hypothetical protein